MREQLWLFSITKYRTECQRVFHIVKETFKANLSYFSRFWFLISAVLAFGFVVATGFYLVKNTPLPAGGRRGIAAECIPNKGTLT
jgi:hypothetical protein